MEANDDARSLIAKLSAAFPEEGGHEARKPHEITAPPMVADDFLGRYADAYFTGSTDVFRFS